MAPKVPPSLESLEAKLDKLLKKVDEISAVKAEMEEMRVAVGTLMETVASQGREIMTLKEQANSRDQQLRSSTVRLYGFGHAAEDTGDPKALSKRVYDCVVKPVLAAAKANKLIDVLPQLSNTITEVYRVRVFSTQEPIPGQPPPLPAPIIIKFANQATRLAFLRSKKEHMPAPLDSDKAAGDHEVLRLGGPHWPDAQDVQADGGEQPGGQGVVGGRPPEVYSARRQVHQESQICLHQCC